MSILDSDTSKMYKIKKLLKKLTFKNIALYLVPIIIVILIWKQTCNSDKSLELNKKDFSNKNLPYLLINNIMYDNFLTNDSITFKLKVINHGATAFNALVSDIKVYENQQTSIDNNFLFDSLKFQTIQEKSISHNFFYVKSNAVCTGNDYRYEDKFLIGKILYRDNFDKNYFTVFAGKFNDDRFIPIGDLNKIGVLEE